MLVCIAQTYFYCRGLHCIVQSDILHNAQVSEGFVNLNVGLLNIKGNNFSQLLCGVSEDVFYMVYLSDT